MPTTLERVKYTRPWLYPKQEAAIFNSSRYAVIEASTKAGKTVGCMVWLAEQAMAGRPGPELLVDRPDLPPGQDCLPAPESLAPPVDRDRE
jgi:hypothetical protein